MEERPELHDIVYTFTQEANCVDARNRDDYETLTVEVKSDLGLDATDGGFIVIRTAQWAINTPEELYELLQRVQASVDAISLDKKKVTKQNET